MHYINKFRDLCWISLLQKVSVQGKTKNQTVSTQQKQVEPKHEKIVDVSSNQTEVVQEDLENKTQKLDLANAPSTEETMTELCSDDLKSEVSSVCNMTKILDANVQQNYRALMDPMLAVQQGSLYALNFLHDLNVKSE